MEGKRTGDGVEEKGQRGEREQTGQSLVCSSVWVHCRSTSGQYPVAARMSPAKTGGQGAAVACLTACGWQVASGIDRLKGVLQLVEGCVGPAAYSLTAWGDELSGSGWSVASPRCHCHCPAGSGTRTSQTPQAALTPFDFGS